MEADDGTDIAPELERHHPDAPLRLLWFALPFLGCGAWIAIRAFTVLQREGIDPSDLLSQPHVRTKCSIVLAVGTMVYLAAAVTGRRSSRAMRDLLARATRVLRTASPVVETLTPRMMLREGQEYADWYILRGDEEQCFRVFGALGSLRRDVPVQAEIFQSRESSDLLLARLPDGKVLLCRRVQQPDGGDEVQLRVASAPRDVPWLVRVQTRLQHGGILFSPAMGVMFLGLCYMLYQRPIEGNERVGLYFLLLLGSLLGTWCIVVGAAWFVRGSSLLRFLRDGSFGWARVQAVNPLPRRWRTPRAELHLEIVAQDGRRHAGTITASPLQWPVSFRIPVMFFLDDFAQGVVQLNVFTGANGFCRFDEQGRIRVRLGLLLYLALSLALGLVFLAPLVYPELLRH